MQKKVTTSYQWHILFLILIVVCYSQSMLQLNPFSSKAANVETPVGNDWFSKVMQSEIIEHLERFLRI